MSTQSASYLRRLKRMVTLIKGLHPLLPHIPSPLPRPGSDSFKHSREGKVDTARQEAYQKADQFRLDSSVAPYWLAQFTDDNPRRR